MPFTGITLQAYLPDSYSLLKEITAWARRRIDAGGSPVKIRIVKGANMEMEKVEAAILDWPLAANRRWAETIRQKWKKSPPDNPFEIPLVIGAEEIFADREIKECRDPSQVNANVIVARYALGNAADVQRAVAIAKADPLGWRLKSFKDRHQILSKVAMEIRHARGDLMGAAAANTGKLFTESDVEVSEAVDFAEYYPHSARAFADSETAVKNARPHLC